MIRILLVSAALLASPVAAQPQNRAGHSAGGDAQTADRALNDRYRTAMAGLSPASRLLLRNAQRSWIGFRDQQCRFEASGVQGGSAYPMVLSQCVARLTQERTRQLARISQCTEGDLACPR